MEKLRNTIAAIAACVTVGVFGTGADALTTSGSLGWAGGGDDFFPEVTGLPGDTFDVVFNPLGTAFVAPQDGVFGPAPGGPFDGQLFQAVSPSTGSFAYVGTSGSGFHYQLTADLLFPFLSGVTVTFAAGTEFVGSFNSGTSVQFVLAPMQFATVSGIAAGNEVIASVFQFSDTVALGGGNYNGRIDVAPSAIPLPAAGLLTIASLGGLVLVGRRRKTA